MKSNYSQETVDAWNHAVELAKDISKHECWRALVAGLLDLRDLCDKWRRPSGHGGTIQCTYYDNSGRRRLVTGYIGENGILPDVAYKCDENGNLVKAG